MAFRFQFGIPPRTAAARSILGRTRGEDGTITPEDDTPKADYDKVTGFSPRDPGHSVTGEYDADLDETTISSLRAFATYPSRLNETDTEATLVVKVRGPVGEDEDGNPTFPSIKIVARPLATQLDYRWTGPAHSPLTGELDTLWKFQGDPNLTYEQNEAAAQSAYVEYGSTRTLEELNYWRAEDVPEGHSPPWTPPTDYEYDFIAYPRPPQDGPYDWQKYETWDFRYRLPSWYGTEQGDILTVPMVTYFDCYYQALTPTWPSDTNPFLGFWIAPVIPGFHIEGGAASIPSITVPVGPNLQSGITSAVETLTAIPQLKFTEDIRKLYPFSFGLIANNSEHAFPYFYVYDNKSPELWGTSYPVQWFNDQNIFKAYATWALELTAENCCWARGYTIRGKVRFKKYIFNLEQEGAVGISTPWAILNPTRPGNTAIGTVNSTIWPGMRFRVERDIEGNDLPPEDAGELDWEVTIDETTATGQPFKFGTFFCAQTLMVDGEPVITLPMDELVYVSDLVVTEIIPPAA